MKQNKGITLVALIITIIVLLILALVTIRAVQGDGIISKAKEAKNEYTDAQTDEAGKIAYYESYLNGTVGQWAQDGDTIKKSNEDGTTTQLKIGDKVTYNPTKDKNGNAVAVQSYTSYSEANASSDKNNGRTSGYTSNQTFNVNATGNQWRVLGMENGQIQLISTNPIGTYYLSGEKGYLNAEEELNAICSIYGQGKGAIGGRSLNAEDINKLGNYNPTSYNNYGTKWTYRFPESGSYMQYKQVSVDGKTTIKDWTDMTTSGFQTFKIPGTTETISSSNRKTSEELTYTYYGNYSVADKVKQTTSDGKNMSDIITKGTGTSHVGQWLASRSVGCMALVATFYVHILTQR